MTTENGQKTTESDATHRFAWDGFAFDVPVEWDLSDYEFGPRVSIARMEDSLGRRLEFEWTRAIKPIAPGIPAKRHAKWAGALADKALERGAVDGLAHGWQGFLYTMPDRHHMVTALYRSDDGRFFGLLRLHFEESGRRKPARILRDLANSFTLHHEDLVPWQFYDVAFRVGRDFWVVSTSFKAGQKLMVFQRRLRKLYLWHFSLADLLLKDRSPAEWAAEFLNRCKDIRGPRFAPGEGGSIVARRAWRYPIGHMDEIGRLCHRYSAACAPIPGKNMIVLAVYNYRARGDLHQLAQALDSPAPLLVQRLTGI